MKLNQIIKRSWLLLVILATTILFISACNLGAPESDQVEITNAPTNTGAAPTRTLLPTGSASTSVAVTSIPLPTLPQQVTNAVQLPPTSNPIPTSTNLPTSILILSPLPNNIISGNTQILGSAIHPEFLQYRVEFGPEPNPNNLWFPITGVVQTTVLNSVLGVWNTTTSAVPDGNYQVRLRVFLRDGSELSTVVSNIRVQNQDPTPVPTNTPNIPRPIAGFTQDITSGNAPLVVKFTNLSQGQIDTNSWNFGDGGNSNQRNPSHTFNTPGLYTVRLTVNGPGGTSNVTRQINVKSPSAPVANFTVSPNSGEAPLTVNFTNTTTGNTTSYTWNFGDNSDTVTQTSPSHTFNEVGTYNVILEAQGPGGQTTSVRQVTVTNPQIPEPVAGFDMSTQTGEVPITLQLTNTSTGNIETYLWDFDGNNITDSVDTSPTTVITTPGEYTIRLIVIGPGGQDEMSQTVTAVNPPDAPVADFTFTPETGDAPLTVAFTNTTTGEATGYVWDFNNDEQPDSTEASPSFTFNDPGTYSVQLTAAGPGGSTTSTKTVTVTTPIEPPVADFDASPTIGEAPLTVAFTNTSVGSELTYSWDFETDGTVDSSENSPSFEFSTAGSYTVTLTVSNSAGTDTATETINVSETVVQQPPTVAFSASPISGTAPLTVIFTNQSIGDITSYEWDYQNDGVVDSTETSPTFTYNSIGDFTAKLTAIGPGGSNEITSIISVVNPVASPVAGFSATPTNLTVAFTSTATGDNLTYLWDFGDGNTSTDANPSHTYATAGTYNVTQTVSNAGGSNAITQPVTASDPVAAPVAGFSATPTNLTVAFTSTATGDNLTYLWDFGDGNTSTDANPSHTYATAGTYNVTQTVSNASGSNAITQPVTASDPVAAPVAGFSATPTNLTVAFTSTATGDNLTYTWDFGDGNTSTDANPSHTYATAGTYNVTQTVSNASGSNAITQPVTASDPVAAPVAGFSATPTNLTVAFTSTVTGDNLTYLWDFGDGNTSTEANPSHTYALAGTYNVTQTVSNAGGSNAITQPVTASEAVAAPVAGFSATPTNLTVAFTSTATGDNLTYTWDFGDGSATSADANPTHVYAVAGTYNVTQTVSNAGGSNAITQTVTVSDPVQQPTIPTGDIVFVSNRDGNNEIYVMNTDGSEPVNVTNNGANDRHPAWSPDGSQIVFSSDRDNGTQDIYTLAIDTLNVTRLTADSGNNSEPVWSPDGSKIAFTSDRTGDNDIFVMNTDGSGQTQLTTDTANDSDPTWSPDSTAIAFVSNVSGNQDIYVINANDGTPILTLTSDTNNDFNPSWLNRNEQSLLAFTSTRSGDEDIWIINPADASGLTQVTFDNSRETQPEWSADGNFIIFVSDRDDNGTNNIYTMTPDGNNVLRITPDGSNDRMPDWK